MKIIEKIKEHKLHKPDLSGQTVRAAFAARTSRHGAYSIAAIVLVLVIAVVVNLLAGQLPSNIRNLDISSNKVYEISDTSRAFLKKLDHDVKITVIAEDASIDDRLKTFLEKYASLSDRIKMTTVDPVLHPSILTDYDTQAETIVVECEDTGLSSVISFSDILVADTSYYYTESSSSLASFDGDGQLTGAINQVTGRETKKLYASEGHGEAELSSSITNMMKKSGITVEALNLLMSGSIPEDCDMLLINGPTSDLSEAESTQLDQYIKKGGSVMLLMSEQGPETGNLINLLESYKITMEKGYIADMQRCYQGNYYYIFPNVAASGDMAQNLSSGMVLAANSRGFTLGEDSEEIALSSFLETSENGYAVSTDSEKQGTYGIAAKAVYTAQAENDGQVVNGSLTVYGSNSIIDESITEAFASLDNKNLFMNSVVSAIGDMDNLSIDAKSMQVQYNTVQYGGYISVVLIFIIPIIVLIVGFVCWMRRRKA
ncbi:GldG family protein [Anaerovorax odorimutans]|uniref:GldG family protein n=1 Tax=Anaerovorax odorimutans TaxID=109327 RepID=A0ABT1RQD5_9FIRM|nr:GldG family protein [Anaerovorax odorimutans]MCQ4637390.1 GldG family protein [Anaerovorax odorimutans]